MEKHTRNGHSKTLWSGLSDWTWATWAVVIISTLAVTRVVTGIQCWLKRKSQKNENIRMAPYWFPWIGHGFFLAWNYLDYIERLRKRMKEPIFRIMLCGVKQTVVTSLPMAESILSFQGASSDPIEDLILEKVFGDHGPIRRLSPASRHELHLSEFSLVTRKFRSAKGAYSIMDYIKREIPNLVTFSRSIIDQTPWERGGDVAVVDTGNDTICEADLFALLTNFVGYITTSAFMGQALAEDFPELLSDLRILDEEFFSLSMSAPRWLPVPGISAAYAARSRLHQALAAFHDALTAWEGGEDAGARFRDFDDVSEPVKQQARIVKESGLTGNLSAPAYLSLLWTTNTQTSNIIFWTVLRVSTDKTLLEDVRKEIMPYAKAWRPTLEETGFPFREPPRVTVDPDGLSKFCPLLKACYYEAIRMDSSPLLLRKLTSDLSLTDGSESAGGTESARRRTYRLKKGSNIAIPYGIFHRADRFFTNPDQYDPLRFIQTTEFGTKEAYVHTINASIRSFGCEGSMLAERDILAFTAAILTMWDIEPAGKCKLMVPGHKLFSATYLPTNDIRVKLRARA